MLNFLSKFLTLLFFTVILTNTTLFALTIHAVNLNDSGFGSLRQAVFDAVPGDKIVIDPTGTITLDSTLLIDKDISIEGAANTDVNISGNAGGDFTLVEIENVDASISSLSFVGTSAHKAIVIQNGASLDARKLNVREFNGARAISVNGSMKASKCRFEHNAKGAISVYGGSLSIEESSFSDNSAGYGGAIDYNDGMGLDIR